MNGIEDLVRRSMREQVIEQPAMYDPAGHALRRAGAARRRRAAVSACAGVMAMVLGVGGFVVLRDLRGHQPPQPPATTTAPPTIGSSPTTSSAAGPTVIVDRRELLLPDGHRIPLGEIAGVAAEAYQIRDGWLVRAYRYGSTEREAASLWLVKRDGSQKLLVEKAQAPVAIAPDGRRFAWRTGDRLKVGHLAGDAVEVDFESPARSERAAPIAFTGMAVVLGYTETGGGIDHWDVWLPGRGDYVPSEERSAHVITVYPPAPDGSLLGLVHDPAAPQGSKSLCLARLDPANNLAATRRACGPQLAIDAWATTISPDQRWLATLGVGGVAVLELTTVFDRPVVAFTWDAQRPGVWLDATTMVAVHRDGGLRRFHVGGSPPEPVAVPGLPTGAQFELVPRLS